MRRKEAEHRRNRNRQGADLERVDARLIHLPCGNAVKRDDLRSKRPDESKHHESGDYRHNRAVARQLPQSLQVALAKVHLRNRHIGVADLVKHFAELEDEHHQTRDREIGRRGGKDDHLVENGHEAALAEPRGGIRERIGDELAKSAQGETPLRTDGVRLTQEMQHHNRVGNESADQRTERRPRRGPRHLREGNREPDDKKRRAQVANRGRHHLAVGIDQPPHRHRERIERGNDRHPRPVGDCLLTHPTRQAHEVEVDVASEEHRKIGDDADDNARLQRQPCRLARARNVELALPTGKQVTGPAIDELREELRAEEHGHRRGDSGKRVHADDVPRDKHVRNAPDQGTSRPEELGPQQGVHSANGKRLHRGQSFIGPQPQNNAMPVSALISFFTGLD